MASTSNPAASGSGASASFADDPRVHYNQVSSKWEFEADDGKEYEWDVARNSWVPLVDETLLAAQQAAYKVEGVDESVSLLVFGRPCQGADLFLIIRPPLLPSWLARRSARRAQTTTEKGLHLSAKTRDRFKNATRPSTSPVSPSTPSRTTCIPSSPKPASSSRTSRASRASRSTKMRKVGRKAKRWWCISRRTASSSPSVCSTIPSSD